MGRSRAGPRHPPAGPVCLVFWADRGPGASCPYGEGPRRALVTFPRWKVTRGDGLRPQARFEANRRRRLLGRDGAAVPNCIIASQSARLVRKNPQFQPHILFSSRRKENVPLTVQEKRAAGGAVPLWRTPPDPLLSAPRTDGFSPHKSFPRHPPAGPFCLVCWADRGPGASCPYGEGPRRALVTFQRWKVMRGSGGAAPQSYPQARFNISRRRRLLDRDGAAPQSCIILPSAA